MAIKQRALMKLDMTEKHVLHVMRTRNKAALGEVYRDLTEARDLYREGLPRSGYAAYGEIYDGLILAVQKVMEGGEANFQEEVLALCQELLEHLERETAKETRFKKEIFFLPYKLSMFDSLESVWRAADEDKEHCIAYVMPIPYADRNPDQTVAAWHCERDQFPKDVPTLGWQQVNLKEWHPDIIVYHSPYDNCNAVTSVDEQYYSRNLRYCADKLVYIPYFVLDEIEPGDEAAEENIAHFITAPGVLNADLIVVQSEKMRQVYINVLSRHTNQGEEYWKAHVSGAGSPKIEKVLTSKKADFEMPEKWRRLVEGKKVILYNTSLTAMLQHSDKVCDKLRYVFDVFRNRDDVVLWWRPHPLMKATFHSMRPQFEEEYLALEKQYIEEGWGIYDDSSDLHRAICWSDAYYGDMSSVVALYRNTGKPILIQNLQTRKNYGPYWAPYMEMGRDGDRCWFIYTGIHRLIELNLASGHASVLLDFSERLMAGEVFPFSFVRCIGGSLYLFPNECSKLMKYDMETGDIEEISLVSSENRLRQEGGIRTLGYVQNDGYIYILTFDICLIEYCLRTGEYQFYQPQECDFPAGAMPFANVRLCVLGNRIYFVLCGFDKVAYFDLQTKHFHAVEVIQNFQNNYVDMIYGGGHFYLLTDNKKIVEWSPSIHHVAVYDFQGVIGSPYGMVLDKDMLTVFYHPNLEISSPFIQFNLRTHQFETPQSLGDPIDPPTGFLAVCTDGSQTIALEPYQSRMYLFSHQMHVWKSFPANGVNRIPMHRDFGSGAVLELFVGGIDYLWDRIKRDVKETKRRNASRDDINGEKPDIGRNIGKIIGYHQL